MSWAKMAVKGIKVDNTSYGVTWNCAIQEENRMLIDQYALHLAQKLNCKSLSVRAGVHDTAFKRGKSGEKQVVKAPWHFTLELLTADGKYRNAHVYTDTKVVEGRDGARVPVTSGIAKVGGPIKENPEIFEVQGHSSAKKNATARFTVKFSSTKQTFKF